MKRFLTLSILPSSRNTGYSIVQTAHDFKTTIRGLARRLMELFNMKASMKALLAYRDFASERDKVIESIGMGAWKLQCDRIMAKIAETKTLQVMPIFPFLSANPIAVVHQQAVGHGGFHTGALGFDRPYLRWIYDCGAWRNVGKQALYGCIADYAEKVRLGGHPVDLLFLSHFDFDHVSGVSNLLEKVKIDTVVVPYLEPADAFVVLAKAAAQGLWSAEFSQAVLDPIRWFSRFGVQRVVRLRPAAGDGPDSMSGVPEEPPPDEPAIAPHRPLRTVLIGPDRRPLAATPPYRGRRASIVEAEAGSAFAVQSGLNWADWAFLPYVHPVSAGARRRLETAAEALIGRASTDAEFQKLLRNFVRSKERRKQLRDIYKEKELGDANATSMSLYIGPSVVSAGRRKVICSLQGRPESGAGWLLTADAKLRNRDRRDKWLKFYKRVRPHFIGTLMLPHHGAAANFEPSILDAAPQASLFVTADSTDLSRPHEDVLADLEKKYARCHVHVGKVSERREDRLWQVSGPPEVADDPLAMQDFCADWT